MGTALHQGRSLLQSIPILHSMANIRNGVSADGEANDDGGDVGDGDSVVNDGGGDGDEDTMTRSSIPTHRYCTHDDMQQHIHSY